MPSSALRDVTSSAVDVKSLIDRQRAFFRAGKTRSIHFRLQQLRALREAIERYEDQLLAALQADLGRPPYEGFFTETMFTSEEIVFAERSLSEWVEDREVPSALLVQPVRSFIRPEPKGVVLIMAPWNYPVQLALAPVAAAIAAGNCIVLKPSEIAPESSRVLAQLVRDTFDPGFVTVVEGGISVADALLAEPWDHIFFTGGTAIGRIVMEKAAKHLTPVTLELGGKSPAFVTKHAKVEHAAHRIAWSKSVNAGQTCVATDYALVDRSIYEPFIAAYRQSIRDRYGADPRASKDYARIVNARHFQRLRGYLSEGTVALGGEVDEAERYIAPTLLTDVRLDAPIMRDEIFGPILPVIPVDSLEAALAITQAKPHPLAMYIFSDNEAERERLLQAQTSGGVVVNDTMYHLGNPHLPFGGVGASGMGAYHGRVGFDTFSHLRAVMVRRLHFENPLTTPPYKIPVRTLRRLLRALHLFV
jgi:aldehyde dehydrogenase (NAD+)